MASDQILQNEFKRIAGRFLQTAIAAKSLHKKRLMNCIEELVTQREFWATVPPGIDRVKKQQILNQQNQRIMKMLTQNTVCPNCGTIDFKFEKASGMAITEHTLKLCTKCKTGFN